MPKKSYKSKRKTKRKTKKSIKKYGSNDTKLPTIYEKEEDVMNKSIKEKEEEKKKIQKLHPQFKNMKEEKKTNDEEELKIEDISDTESVLDLEI
jgi:hypothetical protein